MTVLLRDAIKPNLLQTLEGGPAFVHAGPFANIAHGNNSIIADRLALVTNEIVCTEAGFGADMGAEKFFDIKCRASGLAPDAAVVVATVRALKMHGGVGKIVAGKPLDPALLEENVEAVRTRRLEPRRADRERPQVRRSRRSWRSTRSRPTRPRRSRRSARWRSPPAPGTRSWPRHFVDGGKGAAALAEAVWAAARTRRARSALLYPDEVPLGEKIDTIATQVYGADGIELTPAAQKSLKLYESLGFGHLPVCMAKTQYSISHDANLKGRPTGFTVPIREIRLSAGAGFITPLCGEMRTMPGLPSVPGGEQHRHRRRRGTSSGCSRECGGGSCTGGLAASGRSGALRLALTAPRAPRRHPSHLAPGAARRQQSPARPAGAAPPGTAQWRVDRVGRQDEATVTARPSKTPRAPAPQAGTSIGPSGSSAWAWSSWPWSSPWSSVVWWSTAPA